MGEAAGFVPSAVEQIRAKERRLGKKIGRRERREISLREKTTRAMEKRNILDD
jgi:phage shock protein A